MSARAALSAIAVAVACLPAPGAEAAAVRWWTMRASRSANVTVRITAPTTVLLGEPGDDGPVVQITGGGPAAGFVLTPVAGGPSIGQLAVEGARYSLGSEREVVPPGTYSLRIVAESASVVVRVPVWGATANWSAKRPLRTQRVAANWSVPAGPALLGSAAVTLGASSVALFAMRYMATGASHDQVVELTDAACGDDSAWAAESRMSSIPPHVLADGGFAAFADREARGSLTSCWRVTSVGVATSPAAFALVVG